MTGDISIALNRLVSAYREGLTLALFFDYDGTLTPIVQHPSWARLAPAMRQTLTQLAARPRVCVGVFSGRALDDLKEMVGIPGLYYAGTSGLELDLRGERITHPSAGNLSALLSRVAQKLEEATTRFVGSWLEEKPFSCTLHYRDIVPEQAREFQQLVTRRLEPFGHELRILAGPCAMEVLPELGWNKGTAVWQIVVRLGTKPMILYAGDHGNDADAFAAVASLGGLCIGMGPDAPASAPIRLAEPTALLRFLHTLADLLVPRRT